MKCPKCGNLIPDDSKFCPDCGMVIKDINTIRKQVKQLLENNKQGYENVLAQGKCPQYSEYLTIEGYEKILSFSESIIKYQKEYDYEQSEERKKENELKRLRSFVTKIYDDCPKEYDFFVGKHKIPAYSVGMSLNECEKVYAYKSEIRRLKVKKRQAERLWGAIFGVLFMGAIFSFGVYVFVFGVGFAIAAFFRIDDMNSVWPICLWRQYSFLTVWLWLYAIFIVVYVIWEFIKIIRT